MGFLEGINIKKYANASMLSRAHQREKDTKAHPTPQENPATHANNGEWLARRLDPPEFLPS